MEARYFNKIFFDKEKNRVKKTSLHKLELINEINWYIKLPEQFKYCHPVIYDFNLDLDNPHIELEWCKGITLSEKIVSTEICIDEWKNHLNCIDKILNHFRKIKKFDDGMDIMPLREMYEYKTIKRVNELQKEKEFKDFFLDEIFINGVMYKGINYYLNILDKVILQLGIYDHVEVAIIHGDPCFTNIVLGDSGELKLIDPRGSFGKYDIYGDIRYDWAKISQCINGKYDFIVNDSFDLVTITNKFDYIIYYEDKIKEIEFAFIETLKKNKISIEQIHLIEALLFLSMVPLHKDYVKRQKIMLCKGIETLDHISRKCKL